MARRGLFVVAEGIDGAGKSSVLRAVAASLSKDKVVYHQFFRRNTAWDRFIQARTSSWFYFFECVRQTWVEICPALHQGKIVLQDRYIQTIDTYAPEAKRWRNRALRWLLAPFFLQPDFFVWFQVEPCVAIERLRTHSNGNDRYHQKLMHDPQRIIQRQEAYAREYEICSSKKRILNATHTSVEEARNQLLSFLSL